MSLADFSAANCALKLLSVSYRVRFSMEDAVVWGGSSYLWLVRIAQLLQGELERATFFAANYLQPAISTPGKGGGNSL
jgi:hypothetical protein